MAKRLCRACGNVLQVGEFKRKTVSYRKGYTATDGSRNVVCNSCIKKMREEHLSDDLIKYLSSGKERRYKKCINCNRTLTVGEFKLVILDHRGHRSDKCNSCIEKDKGIGGED